MIKLLFVLTCHSRANVLYVLYFERRTGFGPAPESWQDPMQPLTPTPHKKLIHSLTFATVLKI